MHLNSCKELNLQLAFATAKLKYFYLNIYVYGDPLLNPKILIYQHFCSGHFKPIIAKFNYRQISSYSINLTIKAHCCTYFHSQFHTTFCPQF